MKKVITSIAAILFAAVSVFAQHKGDMYVAGIVNLGLNSTGGISKYAEQNDWEKESETSNIFNIGIAPKFGYFITENFEINVSLKYNCALAAEIYGYKDSGNNADKDKNTATANSFMVMPGVSYHLAIISDKLYYTPAFSLGVGVCSNSSKKNKGTSIKQDPCFAFGLNLDFLAFEYKINPHMALAANIGGIGYNVQTSTKNRKDAKITSTKNIVDFGFDKVCLGFKYYF